MNFYLFRTKCEKCEKLYNKINTKTVLILLASIISLLVEHIAVNRSTSSEIFQIIRNTNIF